MGNLVQFRDLSFSSGGMSFFDFYVQDLTEFCHFLFFCRRMFPTVRCSFTNLRPDRKYYVVLDIVPCDNKRYRYAYHRSSWLVAGKADPPPPHRFYVHPDSPYTGEQLRKQVVSFEKIKLTNNELDKNGQVRIRRKSHYCPSSLSPLSQLLERAETFSPFVSCPTPTHPLTVFGKSAGSVTLP